VSHLNLGGAIEIKALEYSISGNPSAVHEVLLLITYKSGRQVMQRQIFPEGRMFEVIENEIAAANRVLNYLNQKG
jgi:hypothetical protein